MRTSHEEEGSQAGIGDLILDSLIARQSMGTQGLESSDNVKFQLEPRSDLEKFEDMLRGNKFVPGKGVEPIRIGKDGKPKPFLNNLGISHYMGAITAMVTKTNALGLTDKKGDIIREMTMNLILQLNDDFANHWDEWDLDIEDIPFLLNIAENNFYLFLSRTMGGHESERFRPRLDIKEALGIGKKRRSAWGPYGSEE